MGNELMDEGSPSTRTNAQALAMDAVVHSPRYISTGGDVSLMQYAPSQLSSLTDTEDALTEDAAVTLQRFFRGLSGRLRAERVRSRADTIYSDEHERWRDRVSGRANDLTLDEDSDVWAPSLARVEASTKQAPLYGDSLEDTAAALMNLNGLSNASTRCASPSHVELSPLEEAAILRVQRLSAASRAAAFEGFPRVWVL